MPTCFFKIFFWRNIFEGGIEVLDSILRDIKSIGINGDRGRRKGGGREENGDCR
jgi:hypothetical protein